MLKAGVAFDTESRREEMPNISRTAIETRSGRAFEFENLAANRYDIKDIAAALSKQCRYNGHTNRFYSVAEHCVILAHYAEKMIGEQEAIQMLLHDAAEAYIGDHVLPVKTMLPEVRNLEDALDEIIAFQFGLIHPFPAYVKELDYAIVLDERRALFPDSRWTWQAEQSGLKPLGVTIVGWSPEYAEAVYLQTWQALTGLRP
jgi:hypothetical protein